MSNIYFGIPTYKRVDKQITLKYLKEIGVEKEYIILATQTTEEYEQCKELYSNDCTVIYQEKHNLSGNRNTIIDYLPKGSCVLILDDDIDGFEIKKNGKLERMTGKQFLEVVSKMFQLSLQKGSKLWGIYPVRNAYFMEDEFIVKYNRPIIAVHGVVTSELRYNEEQTVKEDYLFVCDNLAKGLPTLRLENMTSTAKHLTNAGGCKDQWGENDECYERILKKYPQYIIPNKKRKGEILLKNNITVGIRNKDNRKVRLF